MDLNINPKIDDTFYRYKMPLLKKTKQGNNCVILNLKDIAKSLSIPSEFIIKYLSLQLGTTYNDNKLTGSYTDDKLISLLYQFIIDFILCKTCSIPELSYDYDKKKQIICTECSACPSTNELIPNNKCNQKMITFFKNYIKKKW